jgi:hypothetical protein
MTPDQHEQRATELVEQGVGEVHFNAPAAELLLKAAEIHARLAVGQENRDCGRDAR